MKRCNLVFGERGRGKTHYVRNVAEEKGYEFYHVTDLGIDSIKELSDHNIVNPRVYCIENINEMSLRSQNALLKVVEEGKDGMYFYLTSRTDNVLKTIRSRSNIYILPKIQPAEFVSEIDNILKEHKYINKQLFYTSCDTYGDVIDLLELTNSGDITKLNGVVDLVYRNIKNVSVSNALRAVDHLKAIEDSERVYVWFLRLLLQRFNDRKSQNLCRIYIEKLSNKTADKNRLMSAFFISINLGGN